ncbi:MAG: tyrosine-type recombinase/integrase [Firmicutes bacterium]|nr:tyrosine-type recombinase/integrase [Bacillota bacterium]
MLDFDLQVERFITVLGLNMSVNTAKAYRSDLRLLKLHFVLAGYDCVLPPEDQSAFHELETSIARNGYRLSKTSRKHLDSFTVDLKRVTADDLVGYFLFLKDTLGYAQSTLNRKIVAVRRFFTYLAKHKLIPDLGIIGDLETKTVRRDEAPKHLSSEEAFEFLDAVKRHGCPRDYAMFLIMVSMGLRVSEVTSMNIDSIGPNVDFYQVVGAKGGKTRHLPVPDAVKEAVADYMKIRPHDQAKGQHRLALFLGNKYTRITSRAVQQKIKEYAELTDLPESKKIMLSPHKLRHTFATALYVNGEDLRTLMRLLGHENISTTTIYTHVDKDKLMASLEKNPFAG